MVKNNACQLRIYTNKPFKNGFFAFSALDLRSQRAHRAHLPCFTEGRASFQVSIPLENHSSPCLCTNLLLGHGLANPLELVWMKKKRPFLSPAIELFCPHLSFTSISFQGNMTGLSSATGKRYFASLCP